MKISELLAEKEKPQAAKDLTARRRARATTSSTSTSAPPTNTPTADAPKKANMPRWYSKKISKMKAYSDSVDRRVAVKMAKWGTPVKWLFRAIGLLAPTIQLYSELEAIDIAYKSGDDPDLQTFDDVQANREQAWGIWTVQATLAVTQMVAAGRIGLYIGRILKWIIGGVGVVAGTATAGAGSAAMIAAMIATEAGFTALETWLGSESGREWIANSFLRGIVTSVGTIPEATWDYLWNKVGKGQSYQSQANQGKMDTAKKQGKEVDPQSMDKDTNDLYINGVVVTKADGTIDPAKINDPRVQLAIANAKKAGKPSDIQSLIAADEYNKGKNPDAPGRKETPKPATPTPTPSAPSGSSSNSSGAAWKPIIAY